MTGLAASFVLQPIDFSGYDELLARLSSLDEIAIDRLSGDYFAMAAAGNPGLAGYALAARKATIAVDVARSGYLPSVSAGLSQGVGYESTRGFSVGAGSLSLTATMSLDLWSTSTSIKSAEVAAAVAALEESAGAESLVLELDVAVNGLLSAAQSIVSLAKALEYAQSSYRNVLEQFKLSAAAASDLSVAEALVSSARTGLIGARYDFLSAVSGLRGLVGLEGEDRITAAIP
jgi:outer membrane protein TolC